MPLSSGRMHKNRQVPNAYSYYFGDKSPFTISSSSPTSTGVFMDSGQEVGSLTGSTLTIDASPIDGATVARTSDNTTHYLVPLLPAPDPIVYARVIMRWDTTGATVHDAQFGLIAWSTRTASTADSAVHTVIRENETQIEHVENAGVLFSPFTAYGGPWSHDDNGHGNWFIVEWALDIANDRGVIRLPDGRVEAFSDPIISNPTYAGLYPCWEPYWAGSGSQRQIEYIDCKASSYSQMNDAQIRYVNDLLATKGYGPLSLQGYPPEAPIFVGSTSGQGADGETPYELSLSGLVDIDGNPTTIEEGDLIIVRSFRDGSTTGASRPTSGGWSDWPENASGGDNSGYATVAYMFAGSSPPTTTGQWTMHNTSGNINLQVQVWRNAAMGAGAYAHTVGSSSLALPTTTLQYNDRSSRMALFAASRNSDPTFSNIAGFTQRSYLSGLSTSTGFASNQGMSSWPSGNMSVSSSGVTFSIHALEIIHSSNYTPPPSGPIQLVGTASAQATNVSVDLSGIDIQPYDLIVIGVYNQDGDSASGVPTGYVAHADLGGNVCNMRIMSKVADGTETSTGAMSSGDSAMVHVFRGALGVGATAINTGTDRILDFPALTLQNTDNTSWVVCFGGTRNENGSMATPPSGMITRQNQEGSTHDAASYDTNGTVSSFSATTVDIGHNTAGGHKAASVEIKVRP